MRARTIKEVGGGLMLVAATLRHDGGKTLVDAEASMAAALLCLLHIYQPAHPSPLKTKPPFESSPSDSSRNSFLTLTS